MTFYKMKYLENEKEKTCSSRLEQQIIKRDKETI